MKALCIGFILAATALTHALDFTPEEVKERGEGGVNTYLRFHDELRPVTFMPPKGWIYRGSGPKFTLAPRDSAGAEVEMFWQLPDQPINPDPESGPEFERLARAALPSGATNVRTVSVEFNPVEVDGHRTTQVTLTYGFFGQPLQASSLFVVRESAPARFRTGATRTGSAPTLKTLVVFRVMAKQHDFPALQKSFYSSLSSLSGL